MGKLVVDKLYAAGLQSLDTLFAATTADIVQTTGIAPSLADRVVGRFQLYRKELHAAQPDATRGQERARLDVLVKRPQRIGLSLRSSATARNVSS